MLQKLNPPARGCRNRWKRAHYISQLNNTARPSASIVNLASITPLILTYNEEANIGRVLDALTWAKRIVIIDSFSTDATLDIVARYPQAEVVQRPFDDFAGQCNFGLEQIKSEWVLSMDADYVCTPELIDEIGRLPDDPSENGYSIPFRYSIFGTPLRGTLYPSRTCLYRVAHGRYSQDGHAHRVQIAGTVGQLQNTIHHDDRKPLESWLNAQRKYARQEADKLLATPDSELGLNDRLRKMRFLAPILAPLYTLFGKGVILDGKAGVYYTLQRAYAELLLSLELLDRDLRPKSIDSHVPADKAL
jgi:glycosyltransferase involved in cell wall biosynthesis